MTIRKLGPVPFPLFVPCPHSRGRFNREEILRSAPPIDKKKPGNDLLSHSAPRAVPSALKGLTSVFGMGTGVSPSLWLPGNYLTFYLNRIESFLSLRARLLG